MKITERRLRSIIRSVIKESRLNEMMGDMYHFDSLHGAQGVSKLASELMRTPISSFNNPRKKSHIETTINEFLAGIGAVSVQAGYSVALLTPIMAFLVGCAGISVLTASGITIGALIGLLTTGQIAATRLAERLGVESVDIQLDGKIKAKIADNLKITAEDVKALDAALSRKR